MTTYYLIDECIVGKEEGYKYFLFKDGKWVTDEHNVIRDHLMGYDPDEPDDSPYKIGNHSIMKQIKKISEGEANEYRKQYQTFS